MQQQREKLRIVHWYKNRQTGKYSAIRVQYYGSLYNMPLHPAYVSIIDKGSALVWSSWIQATISKAIKANKDYQRKKAGLKIN